MSFGDIAILALLAVCACFAVKNIKNNKCTGDCMNCRKSCKKK